MVRSKSDGQAMGGYIAHTALHRLASDRVAQGEQSLN